MKLYDVQKKYNNFKYPKEFLKIIRLNIVDLDFWYLMDERQVEFRINELKERYPKRNLIPFARRDDNDDIACFEVNKGDRVQIIHDYSSEGYEQRKEYNNFWNWFRDAIEEMIEEGEYDE